MRAKKERKNIRYGMVLEGCFMAAFFLGLMLLMTRSVFAEKLWNEDFYRAVDGTGDLSDAQRNDLDKLCIEFMKNYHMDLSLLAVSSERREGMSLEEVGRQYYEECGFGYSLSYDGFQMVWDVGSGEVCIVAIGDAKGKVDEDYLAFVEKTVPDYQEEYGSFGPLYATYRFLDNYLKEDVADQDAGDTGDAQESKEETEQGLEEETRVIAQSDTAEGSKETGESQEAEDTNAGEEELSEEKNTATELPGQSTAGINPEEKGKRVVDRAGLFTQEQREETEKYLLELTEELQKDIVIFTDTTSAGQEHKVYAADFYDYGGYGFGPEFEGVCLFVCMDPEDRGWWCCCTGSETMGLYTETIANQIDDMLYPYMKSGDYYTGIRGWIENIRRMYQSGSPFLESWAVEEVSADSRFRDEGADRVVDDASLLKPEQIRKLEERVKELADAYNVDIAIHTVPGTGPLELKEYADRYYRHMGYGKGEDYKGILLCVQQYADYTPHLDISFFGEGYEELTEEAYSRLTGRTLSLIREGKYEDGLNLFCDMTENYLKKGRVPRSGLSWFLRLLFAVIVGAIIGGIALGRARSSMKTPAVSENADAYLVSGSLSVKGGNDTFLSSTTSRRYDPPSSSSGSSSSRSSSSSYSSSYSGSSGRSHSGSGRSF
ncbi:MAG: TPM domain-containing protein [Lachnospiraceae bacterium]|nr:TPM domain-containing protein [Lachnospiraceae bacterium]